MSGYIRQPAIHGDQIAFVCEDDLWVVGADGGRAYRLTAGVGEVNWPRFSPDGSRLAFTGREEGPAEVFVMDTLGSPVRRLTFHGVPARVVGWRPSGDAIVYSTSAQRPFARETWLAEVSPDGGPARGLPLGPATSIAFGAGGQSVLARNASRVLLTGSATAAAPPERSGSTPRVRASIASWQTFPAT